MYPNYPGLRSCQSHRKRIDQWAYHGNHFDVIQSFYRYRFKWEERKRCHPSPQINRLYTNNEWKLLKTMCLVFFRKGINEIISIFHRFFPEFHFCPTGDFDFPAGFHRSPAVISTTGGAGTCLWWPQWRGCSAALTLEAESASISTFALLSNRNTLL